MGKIAEVVKLADTLASGASGGNPVEVQVLSSAPSQKRYCQILIASYASLSFDSGRILDLQQLLAQVLSGEEPVEGVRDVLEALLDVEFIHQFATFDP